MPNLRWMPTVSPNPEAEHRVFWERKLTRPIDDPFWNKHRPGNRWNCKCSLEATDEPITPLPTEAEIRGDQPQRGLENNPGKDGQLFSNKHPYFPKNCRECGFNKRKLSIKNWFRNAGGDGNCNHCSYLTEELPLSTAELREIKERRKYILKNYKELVPHVLSHPRFAKPILFTKTNVKEWLNQPHGELKEKNELVLNLDKIFRQAK